MIYEVINLRPIRNAEGMWEVNDAHYSGQTIELNGETARHVWMALKEGGVLSKHIQFRWLEIDMEGEHITIRQRRDGRWLWELRPERKAPKEGDAYYMMGRGGTGPAG